ncbi:MAG TPA: hypothetical protein VE783_04635 [Candidatus Limnocylindrales bacterium]|jgi:hypothetical protein|nr:hypothetical protein [Candidatus Limnocylindrales bacterium]
MQGPSAARQSFKSGEVAEQSGVYNVVHDQHRGQHLATVFKGQKFPSCARCGDRVRFLLVRPAALIAEDSDFQQGSSENPKSPER